METTDTPAHDVGDSIILVEEIDPNYVPTEKEVLDYATWLGMDPEADKDLHWIAKEGLKAPLPENWKPCKTTDTGDIYYFNFATGESTWDHPCDGFYKRLYEEKKKKKEMSIKENNDAKRVQAKQDAQQLLGKGDKKSKKKGKEPLEATAAPKSEIVLAPLLERKPLPGIKPIGGPLSARSTDGASADAKDSDSRSSSVDPPNRALTEPLSDASGPMRSSKLSMIGSLRSSGESNLTQKSSSPFPGTPSDGNRSTPGGDEAKWSPMENKPEPLARDNTLSLGSSNSLAPRGLSADKRDLRPLTTESMQEKPEFSMSSPPRMNASSTLNNNNNSGNSDLAARVSSLTDQLNKSETERRRLASKVESLEADKTSLTQRHDQNAVYYHDRVQTLDSELAAMRKQMLQKDDEALALNRQLMSVQMELNRAKDATSMMERDVQRQQATWSDQLQSEQHKVMSLETQLRSLKDTITSTNSQDDRVEILTERVGKLQRENHAIQQDQRRADAEVITLSQQLVAEKSRTKALQQQLSQLSSTSEPQSPATANNTAQSLLQSQILDLEANVSMLTRQNQQLQEQLSDKRDEETRLRQQMNASVDDLHRQLSEMQTARSALQKEVFEKDHALLVSQQQQRTVEQRYEEQLARAQRERNDFEYQLQQQQQQASLSSSRNTSASNAEVMSLKAKIDELTSELATAQSRMTQTLASLQSAKDNAEKYRAQESRLQELLSTAERDKRDLEQSTSHLRGQLEVRTLENAKLQVVASQVDFLRSMDKAREEEVTRLRQELLNMTTSNSTSSSAASTDNSGKLEEMMQPLRMENQQLRRQWEAAIADSSTKVDEVQFLKQKHDQLQVEFGSVLSQYRNLHQEYVDANAQVQSLAQQLQTEVEQGLQKDKKIRGFREELLHLQKRLSEVENNNSNNNITAAAAVVVAPVVAPVVREVSVKAVQTEAVTVTAVRRMTDRAVQHRPLTHDVAVSAQQRNETRTVSTQASDANTTLSSSTPLAAAQAVSAAASMDNGAVESLRQELRAGMLTCTRMIEELAQRSVSAANNTAARSASPPTARGRSRSSSNKPPARAVRAWQHDDDDVDVDDDELELSTEDVNDENRMPASTDNRNAMTLATRTSSDAQCDLDSVSEVMLSPPPPRQAAKKRGERLSWPALQELFRAVYTQAEHYRATNAPHSKLQRRLLHDSTSSASSSNSSNNSAELRSLQRSKSESATALTRVLEHALQELRDRIRVSKTLLSTHKRTNSTTSSSSGSISKAELQELAVQINLAVRGARKMDDVHVALTRCLSELSNSQQQQQQQRRRRLVESMVAMDVSVESLYLDVKGHLEQTQTHTQSQSHAHGRSRHHQQQQHHDPDSLILPDDEDTLDHIAHYDNDHDDDGRDADDGRRHRSSRHHQHHNHHNHHHSRSRSRSVSRRRSSSARARSRSRSWSPSMSSSPSEQPVPSSRHHHNHHEQPLSSQRLYQEQLRRVQRHLRGVQQQQQDSLHHYQQHYSWLGSLVKEIGEVGHSTAGSSRPTSSSFAAPSSSSSAAQLLSSAAWAMPQTSQTLSTSERLARAKKELLMEASVPSATTTTTTPARKKRGEKFVL